MRQLTLLSPWRRSDTLEHFAAVSGYAWRNGDAALFFRSELQANIDRAERAGLATTTVSRHFCEQWQSQKRKARTILVRTGFYSPLAICPKSRWTKLKSNRPRACPINPTFKFLMRYIEPHAHMMSRTTVDSFAMVSARCQAVCEPAFWAGFDPSSLAIPQR
jgi:hypothetical protein